MRPLRLVALSEDGRSLVLALDGADGDEERFELRIDDRVRAAARGDTRRLGQIEVDSALSPRVIQQRIRAGETPEQVAEASGTRVERIMRFAHPVLQERERVADQAREARVRLSEGTPSVPLQQFLSERLRLLGADLDAVRWDAARSDDGTWVVTAAWQAGAKEGTTQWVYDLGARAVSPLDAATRDFAEGTRLVRVVPGVPPERPALPVHRSAAPQDRAPERTAPAAEPPRGGPADRRADAPDAPDDEDVSEHDTVVLRTGETDGEDEDPRARVPAWEDIVFGVRRNH
ncbi:septation protein SepH [Geodermatophilus sp. URMC 62]|uniref:septation protein SepH n=1 Tax=Geodermatophilus sp. URMC 62 TaxID=3423414 RepID=UPI00406CC346